MRPPECASGNTLCCLDVDWAATPLISNLDHAREFALRVQEFDPLLPGEAQWLLHVDVLPRLQGIHRDRVVRKIGRRYDHGVQVAILDKVPIDSIVTGLMAASASDGPRAKHPRFICFADRANPNGRLIETRVNELHSAKTSADDAYNDLIGEWRLGGRKGPHTARKKYPAIHRI